MTKFKIHRGINISHWLSQVFGWSPVDTFFTAADIAYIAEKGFDHIRLPIDEERLWDADEKQIEAAFAKMLWCIDESLKNNLKVIVDLHILRSHHFNNSNNSEGAMTLWIDPKAQERFLDIWSQLSAVLNKYPTDMVAYELMNEPVAPTHDDWNRLIKKAMSHIRALEPERIIFWGSNMWQFAATMPFLEIPENDQNVVLSFHTYEPIMLTHYKAPWMLFKDYSGAVVYPGVTFPESDCKEYFKTADPKAVEYINTYNAYYDKEKLFENMKIAIDKAKSLGLQLYCGEFGCLPSVGRELRLKYYTDIISLFDQNEIAYTAWDYKGDFGIRSWNRKTFENTGEDQGLIDALLGK